MSFTPVLVPMSRGILATCTAPLRDPGLTADQAYAAYAAAYADEPFVHLLPAGQWPQTQSVLGANTVHVQVDRRPGRRPAGRRRGAGQPDQGHRRRRRPVHEPGARPARDHRPAAGGGGAMSVTAAAGFLAGGVAAGLKSSGQTRPGAGGQHRARLRRGRRLHHQPGQGGAGAVVAAGAGRRPARAVILNSGGANACTGRRGSPTPTGPPSWWPRGARTSARSTSPSAPPG